jgi:hypothetical protein
LDSFKHRIAKYSRLNKTKEEQELLQQGNAKLRGALAPGTSGQQRLSAIKASIVDL